MDIVVGILAFFGAVFVLFAAIGLLRMPDTYLRLAVTTKAATLGVGMLLIAAAIHTYDLSILVKVLAIILFILLTAPVSAHLIGRTAYMAGIKLWEGSVMDELAGKYDHNTEELGSETQKEKDAKLDEKR